MECKAFFLFNSMVCIEEPSDKLVGIVVLVGIRTMALAQVLEQDKAEELDIEQEPGQDTVLAVVQVRELDMVDRPALELDKAVAQVLLLQLDKVQAVARVL